MTPQEKECINELLEAATINGVSIPAAAQSIGEVMTNLTATEVADICRVHAEELGLNAAQAHAIAETIKVGRPDFESEPPN